METYSFVFTRSSAEAAFPKSPPDRVIVAVLAGIRPGEGAEGCRVFLGQAPEDPEGTVCLGTDGPGADLVQRAIVERLEAMGVEIPAIYDGGPEPETVVAEWQGGRWQTA
jgi:hypothetical protein